MAPERYDISQLVKWHRVEYVVTAHGATVLRLWYSPTMRPDSRDACLVPPVGPRLGAALNGRVGEGRR